MPGPGKTLPQKLALVLGLVLLAVNIWRAAIQSCTIDEAFTFNEFASKPLAQVLTLPYDANNQVLHTILCHWVMQFFGVSELTLRVPSLLGGMLFLAMSYRLCRLYFGSGWLFLATFSLLTLNPFTLDYLSVARGYGLAAGLYLVAVEQLSRHLPASEWTPRRLTRASFALGLSVTANLTFVIPSAALVMVWLSLEAREKRRVKVWPVVNQLILPGTVLALAILLLPLIRASRGNFYFGAPSIGAAIESMTSPMLVHHRYALTFAGAALNSAAAAALAFAGALIVAVMLWAARPGRDFSRRMPVLLTGGSLLASCAMLVAAHYATGVPYPHSRTGIYLVVLLTLAAGGAAEFGGSRAGGVFSVAAIPLLVLFAAQLTNGPYNMWVFDSGTKRIVKMIRSDMARRHRGIAVVSASNFLQPSLNFYRRRYHMNGVARLENGPVGPADYFVLQPEDEPVVTKFGLTVLYRDPVSEEILARSSNGPS